MAKPKSSNRSIRLPDELWAWLAAEADRRQTSVNGLVGDFLIVARLKAEEAAADLVKPKPPGFKVKPIPSGPTHWPSGAALLPEHTADPGPSEPLKVSVQIGPIERKPGSLQKGPKK